MSLQVLDARIEIDIQLSLPIRRRFAAVFERLDATLQLIAAALQRA